MVFLFLLNAPMTIVSEVQEAKLTEFRNQIITYLKENPPNKPKASETAGEALKYIKDNHVDANWKIRRDGSDMKHMYLTTTFGFSGTDSNYSKVSDFISDLKKIKAGIRSEPAPVETPASKLSYTHVKLSFSELEELGIKTETTNLLLRAKKDITENEIAEGAQFALQYMLGKGILKNTENKKFSEYLKEFRGNSVQLTDAEKQLWNELTAIFTVKGNNIAAATCDRIFGVQTSINGIFNNEKVKNGTLSIANAALIYLLDNVSKSEASFNADLFRSSNITVLDGLKRAGDALTIQEKLKSGKDTDGTRWWKELLTEIRGTYNPAPATAETFADLTYANAITNPPDWLSPFIADGKINVTKTDDKFSATALHWAAYYGALKIVKQLVESEGADINAKNKGNETALDVAKRNKRTDVVNYLDSVILARQDAENSAAFHSAFNETTALIRETKENLVALKPDFSDFDSITKDNVHVTYNALCKTEESAFKDALVEKITDVTLINIVSLTPQEKAQELLKTTIPSSTEFSALPENIQKEVFEAVSAVEMGDLNTRAKKQAFIEWCTYCGIITAEGVDLADSILTNKEKKKFTNSLSKGNKAVEMGDLNDKVGKNKTVLTTLREIAKKKAEVIPLQEEDHVKTRLAEFKERITAVGDFLTKKEGGNAGLSLDEISNKLNGEAIWLMITNKEFFDALKSEYTVLLSETGTGMSSFGRLQDAYKTVKDTYKGAGVPEFETQVKIEKVPVLTPTEAKTFEQYKEGFGEVVIPEDVNTELEKLHDEMNTTDNPERMALLTSFFDALAETYISHLTAQGDSPNPTAALEGAYNALRNNDYKDLELPTWGQVVAAIPAEDTEGGPGGTTIATIDQIKTPADLKSFLKLAEIDELTEWINSNVPDAYAVQTVLTAFKGAYTKTKDQTKDNLLKFIKTTSANAL